MKNTKTFICLLGMLTVLSVRPAFAVVEPIKVLQYSLRNVQATIEVIENALALGNSIQQTTLQGTIGAVAPKVMNLGSKMELQSFMPTLPADLNGIVSGNGLNAVPQVRTYVENEMKNIRLGDGVTQRDVLNKINEMQNLTSLDALQIATETLAKSNSGAEESKAQLNNVGGAADSQAKASQETAQSIQILQNDAVRNQLTSNILLNKATQYKNELIRASQSGEQAVDQAAALAQERVSQQVQDKIKNALKQLETSADSAVEQAGSVRQEIGKVSNQINNVVGGRS